MGLVDKIRSKLETRRLEQKYARRNNRRTSVPNIEYVAGEYVLSDMTNKRGDINANRSRRRSSVVPQRARRSSMPNVRENATVDRAQEAPSRPRFAPQNRNRESIVLRYMDDKEEDHQAHAKRHRPSPRTRDSALLRNMDYVPGEETRSRRAKAAAAPRNRESVVLGNMLDVPGERSDRKRSKSRQRESIVLGNMADWADC